MRDMRRTIDAQKCLTNFMIFKISCVQHGTPLAMEVEQFYRYLITRSNFQLSAENTTPGLERLGITPPPQ